MISTARTLQLGFAALVSVGLLFGVARAIEAAPGDLDPSFGVGGRVTTDFESRDDFGVGATIQPDGKIVVAGNTGSPFNIDFALARYNPDGILDSTFGSGGKVRSDFGTSVDAASDVVVQPDGKLVAAGRSASNFAVVRYNADGSLDTSFGVGGLATADFGGSDQANALILQPDGKLVLAGFTRNQFALARFNADGTIDTSFGSDGKVTTRFGSGAAGYDAEATADGKIVVSGRTDSNFALARYDATGALDPTFGAGGKVTTDLGGSDQASGLAIDAFGRVVATGPSSGDFALARYNLDGSLDPGFGTGGIVRTDFSGGSPDNAFDVVVHSDGRMTVAGESSPAPGSAHFALARYDTAGNLDAGFGAGGKVTTAFPSPKSSALDVLVQPDGKVFAIGGTRDPAVSGSGDFALARYLGEPVTPIAPAFLQWSVDGELAGTEEGAPEQARDFRATWTGDRSRAVLVWIKDGKLTSSAIESPVGANDFRVVWRRAATRFREAFWTRGGVDLERITIAADSNGVYVRLIRRVVFDTAFWTNRSHTPIREITPPPGANDLRLELRSARLEAGSRR